MTSRVVRGLAAAVALAFTAACQDVLEPDDREPQFTTMKVTVGTQVVAYNKTSGAVTGGPIVLTANASQNVNATFELSGGAADTLVTSTDFRLDVNPATAAVTFTRTGPFAGTIRGVTTGTHTVSFSLFHIGEGHSEVSFSVPVTVNP